ncbi:MAG: response regulator transcription factor [Saprospiraceae bacterium]|nr:response regulator transcription factor [Saprospiraceae bacterium]
MGNIKILIVDDHVIVREGIKILLMGKSGIKIIGEAANSDELFQCLKRLKPDIILLDIEMPKLNGIEITKILKTDFPGIKVIILSVNNSIACINQAFKAGAFGYLTKKTRKDEIYEAIKLVYQGQKYIAKNISGFVDALHIA